MATARCTWTAVSGVDGYNVYLKSNGTFVKQNSELVTDTVYDIENLEDGNYEAYATSVLNSVESDASNVKGFEVSTVPAEPVDVSSGLPSGSYTASGVYLGNTPERGWDNSQATWAEHRTNADVWFQVDLGEQYTVVKMSNWFRNGSSTMKDWRIQGSNNESTWDDLLIVTDGPRDGETHEYDMTTTGAYRYYRMYVDINHGGLGTRAYDIRLFGF